MLKRHVCGRAPEVSRTACTANLQNVRGDSLVSLLSSCEKLARLFFGSSKPRGQTIDLMVESQSNP
jgi:hypothetical protein